MDEIYAFYAQIFKATRIYVKNREFSIEEDSLLFIFEQMIFEKGRCYKLSENFIR